MKKGRTEEIGIYLTKDELDALEEIRWRERKKKTEIGREAILEYITNHAEGNSSFKLDKWNEDPDFKAVPTISSNGQIWHSYLKDCTPEELTNLMVQTMRINKQCKTIKGLK